MEYPPSTLPKAGDHCRIHTSFTPTDSRSSSLQKVWAEDYIPDEYSSHHPNQLDGIITSPARATLTDSPSARNTQQTQDEDQLTPRESRSYQTSLAALLPFRTSRTNSESPKRSPQRSPTKEKLDVEFMATLTGDKDGQIKIEDRSGGGFSGWFGGNSSPFSVGVPVDEFEDSRIMPPLPASSRYFPATRSKSVVSFLDTSPQTPTRRTSMATSRFAFFSPKSTNPKPAQVSPDPSDELLTLDIRSALFPSGDIDPFSPAAFKNLLQNAEGLLHKIQNGYKMRTISLQEVTAEKEAQAEELEEAETRAKHLKLQLEDMAKQVMAHEEEMKKVLGELVQEKHARAEEKEAREKSITFIQSHRREVSEVASEDLEVEIRQQQRQPWRRSDATINSEISFESDDEVVSSAESVFDRSRSPSLASASLMSTPEMGQAVFAKVVNIGPGGRLNPIAERPPPVRRKSTFQKILSGISPTAPAEECHEPAEDEVGIATTGCRNCRGGSATAAWDTVGLLKMENRGLKERLDSVERAMEGALDVVNGLRG